MAKPKTKQFQTETKKLLQLMIHSLYSNKEIFLRELISNASDALDKLRFESLQNKKIKHGDLSIKIIVDKENKSITVMDNGIGMSESELIENIGTIAKSGTSSFLEKLTGDKKKDSQLIGQFGVGFYSSFMVADRVEVLSKSALNSTSATLWKSDGGESYTLEKSEHLEHGTSIVIKLNKDNEEFLDESRIRFLINKYSEYINFPINIQIDDEDEERVNNNEAIWLKSKRSVKKDEYEEFYKYISNDFNEPLLTIHNKVEGKQEYSNLLYIPKKSPFDIWNRDTPKGLKLYIQRVFIMDDASHFLPLYLRFVKGVVDSNDLPLNVSREILQDHPLVHSIKTALTKRVINSLRKLKKDDRNQFTEFWSEFGLVLKEGPAEEPSNKDDIAELFIFSSTVNENSQINRSFDDYIESCQSEDKKIYYCIGETYEACANSPHIESLKKANTEVLLLTDRIDEWLMTSLSEYKGYELVNVAKTDVDSEPDVQKLNKDSIELIKRIEKVLGADIERVATSSRLIDSAVRLVISKFEPGIQMRKILESAGQALPESKPLFEINLKHKLIKKLKSMKGKEFSNFCKFLFDYAVIAEGGSPKDPSKYLRQLDKYLL